MVEIQRWKQVYMTTNVPADDGGNYYYPALVPANATVQLPVTDIAPDPALGDRGLKFDWATNTWNTSENDPTNKKIAELQQIITGLTTNQLNMIVDQTNTDSQEPAQATPAQASQAQATQSTPAQATPAQATQSLATPAQASQAQASQAQATPAQATQSGMSISDMASMLNNPSTAKKGDK